MRRCMCRCINNGMNAWKEFKCCCVKQRETYNEFSLIILKMILAAIREVQVSTVIMSSSTMFDLMCLYEICPESRGI